MAKPKMTLETKLVMAAAQLLHARARVEECEKEWDEVTRGCDYRIDGDLDCVHPDPDTDPVCAPENCPILKIRN